MPIALNKKYMDIVEKAGIIAKKLIASREDLYTSNEFPFDIWKKMGKEKLLGVGVPEIYGGLGGNYQAIAMAGEAMVHSGHNMGIVLSWLLQNLIACFLISDFGNEDQKQAILPKMADGSITAAFAVSEPGAGAHPKRLTTLAESNKDGFIINGSKTYLTNGPIADLFVVIAITGYDGGIKKYSAFLVERDADGLTISEPMRLDALRPSPHGGITLKNCFVQSSAMLGGRDAAYDDMVKPFREIEDIMMMGPLTGASMRQLELFMNMISSRKYKLDDEQKASLGKIDSLIRALKILAAESAMLLENDRQSQKKQAYIIAFRSIFKDVQSGIGDLILQCGIEADNEFKRLSNDLGFSGQIAPAAAKLREIKYGDYVMTRKEFNG